MVLVQLFLPLYRRDGSPFEREVFTRIRDELVEGFGGLTAYSRAPARGLWQEQQGETVRDDLVIYEVMVERLDPAWWRKYREELEERLVQEQLVIRASEITLL